MARFRGRAVVLVTAVAMAMAPVVPAHAGTTGAQSAQVSAAPACPTAELVGVRGSNEKKTDDLGFGFTVYSTIHAVETEYQGSQKIAIDYPAIPVDIFDPKYPTNYRLSVNAGKLATSSFLAAFHARCPATPVELVGYSQGAQVAGDVYQQEPARVRRQIVGLALFGDPRFNPGQKAVDHGSYESADHGVWAQPPPGANGTVRTFTADEVKAVASYCLRHDPVCGWSLANGLTCAPKLGLYCAHMHYVDAGYTDQAVKWLLGRLPPKALPLAIVNAAIPAATVGASYTAGLYGIGGVPPYTWRAAGSLLTDGLIFTQGTAALAGKPKAAGQFTLSVTLADKAGHHVARAFVVYVTQAPTGTADWTMTGRDAGQSYDNIGEKLIGPGNVAQLDSRWPTLKLDGGVMGTSLEYAGTVYTVNYLVVAKPDIYSDVLVARSLADGSTQWSRTLTPDTEGGGAIEAIGDGVIVVKEELPLNMGGGYYVVGLSLKDGSQLWSTSLQSREYDVVDIAVDGDSLIGYIEDGFGVLDVKTGALRWWIAPFIGPLAEFAVSYGIVVTIARVKDKNGDWLDYLEGLSEADGHVVWKLPPLAQLGDYASVEASGKTLLDFNPITLDMEDRDVATGALIWKAPVNSTELWCCAATDGRTAYAAVPHEPGSGKPAVTSDVQAIQRGHQLWHARATGFVTSVCLANGVLYVLGANYSAGTETIEAFAAVGGRLLWKSPAVPEDQDQLYVARGYLVAGSTVFTVN